MTDAETIDDLRQLLREQVVATAAAERKLSDWFAGQALLGLVGNDAFPELVVARRAWCVAENMMRERRQRRHI